MKTIDEAIQFHIDEAKKHRDKASLGLGDPYDITPDEHIAKAEEHELYVKWLTELAERRKTEPIVYEVTEYSQGFTVETHDDRNIGLRKVSSSDLDYVMGYITEKYWDEGLRVVFKYYCGNGDEWQKIY